jgi:hypothetical protein
MRAGTEVGKGEVSVGTAPQVRPNGDPPEADWTSCLACVASHLAADGLLIFDADAADTFHHRAEATTTLRSPAEGRWRDEEFEPLVSVEQDGCVYSR